MFVHEEFFIDPEIREPLIKEGFQGYKQFLSYSGGELVSLQTKRPVRTLYLIVNGRRKKYFLKQVPSESPRVNIKRIRKGRPLHVNTFRELQMLKFYEEQGLPVMQAKGWGERRLGKWPLNGFLLVEEVQGAEFSDLYKSLSRPRQKQLLHAYGALVGYLHRSGISSRVRCRDIKCTTDSFDHFKQCMVIIDRECGKPVKQNLSPEERALHLAKLLLVNSRLIGLPGASGLLGFLNGYCAEHGTEGPDRAALADRIRRDTAMLLKTEEKYSDIRPLYKKGSAGPALLLPANQN